MLKGFMKYMLLCFFIFCIGGVGYSQELTREEEIGGILDKLGLTLIMPVEAAYQFQNTRKNEFFTYDYRIKEKAGHSEILIAVFPKGIASVNEQHPHLAFQRYLPNLAPNNDDQEIMVLSWGDRELMERNADWGAEAYMSARKEITSFPKTKFIGFFKEDIGMVFMAYCFDNIDELPLLLKFKDADQDK